MFHNKYRVTLTSELTPKLWINHTRALQLNKVITKICMWPFVVHVAVCQLNISVHETMWCVADSNEHVIPTKLCPRISIRSLKGNIFSRYWPLASGIHRPPEVGGHSQWRGALVFSMMFAWANVLAHSRPAGDLRWPCAFLDGSDHCWENHSHKLLPVIWI